ncbi:integral membrane protein-like protein [Aureobasidium pullulans]|uniref:Integral membrane protein-like protein n=1 Tax=Aureobasidium pullulans TaxID=5580 RepID=A0AB74JR72_AURPU|nr:integral membrane protein-like protein [Aureobasidium pullulans]THX55462.1 integral membrane protein-like protein [Aureobasidium pullulans]
MRPTALIPVIFGLAAFVLTMLCIFAGSKKDFMQEYAIVTLNTSRIGTNVFNTTSSTDSDSNIFESIWDNVTNSIESSLNDKINSFAQDLGLHDFYSAHLLDYCSGYYTPTDLPNATFSKSDIDQNITYCSNRTSFFRFNPTTALEQELNKSGLNITLEDLHWPEAVNDGVHALRVAQKAAFLLYCIAAGLLLLATFASLVSFFFNGRLSAFVDISLWFLAFLAIALASAITTAVAIKASSVINKHGKDIGNSEIELEETQDEQTESGDGKKLYEEIKSINLALESGGMDKETREMLMEAIRDRIRGEARRRIH